MPCPSHFPDQLELKASLSDIKEHLASFEHTQQQILNRLEVLEQTVASKEEQYEPELSSDPYWIPNRYPQYHESGSFDYEPYFKHNLPSDVPRFQSPSCSATTNKHGSLTPQQMCEAGGQPTPPFGMTTPPSLPVVNPTPPSLTVNSTPASSMPFPLPVKNNENSLPSDVIQKNKLEKPGSIIKLHPKLKVESKIGNLAVKLCRGAFFGSDVMARCTVQGARDFPGLPTTELGELKKVLFSLFPLYWQNPAELEPLWTTCLDSIGQACKHLRHAKQ